MKRIVLIFLCFWCLPSVGHAAIVNTKELYTYEALTKDIENLAALHPDLITFKSLTSTGLGRKIWALKLGNGETTILLHGAHHAREWLTSALLMKMIETYADAYESNQAIEQFSPRILETVSIWVVPMVNPDGVTLQQFGLYAFPAYIHSNLIQMNKGSKDFNRWKANLQGIDLNRQYPANWEGLKGVSLNPSYQFYKGTEPLEAKEVKALVDFTYEIDPELVASYHSSGNMLFWGFHRWGLTHTTEVLEDYYNIAEKVADITKYELEEPKIYQQGGGYTDWFVLHFKRPALTVEIGSFVEDTNLPLSSFPTIWERNKEIGLFLAKKAYERKNP
ncbi:M14 family metallopeptidase [Robertmurraya kyonggiensis]|uniref:Peptidase M14 n=1 Tax=Robertmurraya kyonggiensis TaxID=1037680 RepID=A0A4U1D8T6_9BACI|nr:M14 family metallocarboxypeptidase [Robertmurraya kyonggiensis]TKC18965.1 peptidase M14 [Robertmurraya kyonggiensis]